MRYWLPIFLASTIPAALGIDWLMSKIKDKKWSQAWGVVLMVLVACLSYRLVFLHPEDGLIQTRAVLKESIELRDNLLILTEPDAVIVVDYADKILFPERQVVVPLRSGQTLDALVNLVERNPLYYFGITLPEKDFSHLNEGLLQPRGLVAWEVQVFDHQTLYQIETYE